MSKPAWGTLTQPEDGAEVADRPPRQAFLVGCRNRGMSTIWFLRPTAPPVPGPWDVAVVLRKA
jgi:hypothetical protein